MSKELNFSQRNGYKKVEKILQVGSMNNELRTNLWNIFYRYRLAVCDKFREKNNYDICAVDDPFTEHAWTDFFKKPLNEKLEIVSFYDNWFKNAKWYKIYDFFEFYVL